MRKSLALILPLMVAACATPAPPPPRQVAIAPTPLPPPPPVTDWRDRPYTPGLWRYADRTAMFGPAGTTPLLTIRCDAGRRLVILSVWGNIPSLTIRTSYAERTWPAQAGADGRSAVTFASTDPALDQIAFSRGRFSVAGPGLAEIDVPAWAEPARVVEDCRG
ncbi:hypothetical protein ACSBM8_13600 [Sphingomonas sp. ASY06-1R]|uniref:hypothetical protein n=1 Tax=Sphingomonas sp. ASY06-1R TaxID=3445771 RepID=UPI003FA31B8C